MTSREHSATLLSVLSSLALLDVAHSQTSETPDFNLGLNSGVERRKERRSVAREEYPELTRKLINPLARVLSIPTSFEYLEGAGANGNGQSFTIRIAPRVPFVLSEDWHLISKTDLAWTSQQIVVGTSQQEGLTDLKQTLFFSPNRSLGWGVYWGMGPTIALPTATQDFLGTDKLSIGPSSAVYKQTGPWSSGILFNHVWSVAGSNDANYVSASRIEPMIAFTAPTATTIAASAEINHNWQAESWVVPVELRIAQLTMIVDAPIQWSIGAKHYFSDAEGTPEWGAFFQITVPLGMQP